MKRDMELIRRIVLALQPLGLEENLQRLEGVDADVFFEHGRLLIEAGLADGLADEYMSGGGICLLRRLTWEGHEFADAVESESVWKSVRDRLAAVGSWTVPIVQSLATDALKRQLGLS